MNLRLCCDLVTMCFDGLHVRFGPPRKDMKRNAQSHKSWVLCDSTKTQTTFHSPQNHKNKLGKKRESFTMTTPSTFFPTKEEWKHVDLKNVLPITALVSKFAAGAGVFGVLIDTSLGCLKATPNNCARQALCESLRFGGIMSFFLGSVCAFASTSRPRPFHKADYVATLSWGTIFGASSGSYYVAQQGICAQQKGYVHPIQPQKLLRAGFRGGVMGATIASTLLLGIHQFYDAERTQSRR